MENLLHIICYKNLLHIPYYLLQVAATRTHRSIAHDLTSGRMIYLYKTNDYLTKHLFGENAPGNILTLL